MIATARDVQGSDLRVEEPAPARDRSFHYVALLRTGLILLAALLLAIARQEPSLKLAGALQFLDTSIVLWCLFHLSILVGFNGLGKLRDSLQFHVSIDVVFACALVWWTGGVQSFFLPILYATVLSCSAFCGARVAMGLASVATLNLLLMTVADFNDWSPARWNGVSPFGIRGRGPFVIMCLVGEGIAFHLIASLGARLMGGLRRAERINDLIVASIGEGVLVLDEKERLLLINDQALRILNFPLTEEWKGRSPRELLRRDSDRELLDLLLSQKRREVQLDWEPAPGRSTPLSVRLERISPVGSRQALWLMTLRDRTVEVRAAQAEVRVKRLKEIEDLSLGIVHEIRNPLASLRGCVQEIARGHLAPEQVEQFSRIVVREADRLDRIVNEFFEMSRARPTKYEPVRLSRVLRDVVESLRARPDASDAQLNFDPGSDDCWVLGEQEMLYRVFLNLGVNALEARGKKPFELSFSISRNTPEQGTERRSVDDSEVLEVCVEDNGVGMDEGTRERVFHAFFSTKAREGGLGLALVERIIAGHQGTISVESEPGRGTRFLVRLPSHAMRGDANGGAEQTNIESSRVVGVL